MILDVPRPWLLSANNRLHFRQRIQRTQWIREAARVEASRTCQREKWAALFGSQVHCTVHVIWPDKRRRDVLNLAPTVKAAIDGIVLAQSVMPDDSDEYLIGPDFRTTDTLCQKGLACRLHFTFEAAA